MSQIQPTSQSIHPLPIRIRDEKQADMIAVNINAILSNSSQQTIFSTKTVVWTTSVTYPPTTPSTPVQSFHDQPTLHLRSSPAPKTLSEFCLSNGPPVSARRLQVLRSWRHLPRERPHRVSRAEHECYSRSRTTATPQRSWPKTQSQRSIPVRPRVSMSRERIDSR